MYKFITIGVIVSVFYGITIGTRIESITIKHFIALGVFVFIVLLYEMFNFVKFLIKIRKEKINEE